MSRFLIALASVVFVAIGWTGFWYRTYLVTPAPGHGEVVVVIPKGTGVRDIGALLAAHGVLDNDIRYLVLVYLSGLKNRLKAGEYSISLGMTPPDVLALLVSGRTLRHHVTIPEGMTAAQIAAVFAQGGWIKQGRFLALVEDNAFARQLGIEARSLEGYLFPETYTLVRNEVDEAAVIRMMVARFQQVWQALDVSEFHGLNRHQLLTLASIVEKETGAAVERPLIAGVFYNRLAKKMRLQSDPTVIYGIPGFNGSLTKADLQRETPYNTYVIPGLPPGPICNPGRAALEAVLHPVASNALYFVSKNDGTHIFSADLAEHNQAVQRYQRAQ
jgi:conserved hypothetical protein, YceG family